MFYWKYWKIEQNQTHRLRSGNEKQYKMSSKVFNDKTGNDPMDLNDEKFNFEE
jgi:hypothetical protein